MAATESKGLMAAVPAILASPLVRKRVVPVAWRLARRHPVVATIGALGAGYLWFKGKQDASTI